MKPHPFAMIVNINRLLIAALLMADLCAAEFIFINNDGPGEGLNDTTPAAPVGGNLGTTLGAQRLAILNYVGEIWGSFLVSDVPIVVNVGFDALGSNVLAGAAAVSEQADFPNAPESNTWYPIALANALAGVDLEPGVGDINITASSNGAFYYGLDSASPGGMANFVDVLLHEVGHGLGFASFINGQTGNLFIGKVDIFSTFILDRQYESSWANLTSAERVASALNDPYLVWDGAFTTAGLPQVLTAQPSSVIGFQLTATLSGPVTQFMPIAEAAFGPSIPNSGLTGELAITSPAAACAAITNSADLAGKIAFIRRGDCNFDDKVYRAQLAGATAVVIANNVDTNVVIIAGGDSNVDEIPVTISIPTVMVSEEDGDLLLAASPGVQLSFAPIVSEYIGAYANQLRLYAPFGFESGSSVSHWTTDASPNLLMEPIINPSLDRQLDMTLTQMKDIGWTVIDIPYPHLTYESWQSLVFEPTDTLIGPDNDLDFDGVSNLEEYFFGNNPKLSDAVNLPVFQFTSGQGDLVFTRSKLTTDLSYVMDKSTTLDSFEPAVEGVDYQILSTVDLSGEDAEKITLRLLTPPPTLFLRLRITASPIG